MDYVSRLGGGWLANWKILSIYRITEIVSRPRRGHPAEWRITPFEGGEGAVVQPWGFEPLNDFPGADFQFTTARLTSRTDIRTPRAFIPLFHGICVTDEFNRAMLDGLQSVGLSHGRAYVVEDWVVPFKVVTLKDVPGAYYFGLFDPC